LKKAKTKPVASQEFQDVCQWYQMEFAHYSFEAVRDAIPRILEGKWDERAPEHYLTLVGLICVYARPFTRTDVGKLSEEFVPEEPEEFRKLHGDIMTLRHQLFAHGDASLTVGKDDYPNEAVIENDGQKIAIAVSRASVKPIVVERMLPLAEALIEKTYWHRQRLFRKFSKTISRLGKGEFRLNVLDPDAPIFVPLTEEEKLVRKKKRSAFDFSEIL
jgi:hypothetical protein